MGACYDWWQDLAGHDRAMRELQDDLLKELNDWKCEAEREHKRIAVLERALELAVRDGVLMYNELTKQAEKEIEKGDDK